MNYRFENKKYPVFGSGNQVLCNSLVEAFFRIKPELQNKIYPGKDYCSDEKYKELSTVLLINIDEYLTNGFEESLSDIDENEKKLFITLSDVILDRNQKCRFKDFK